MYILKDSVAYLAQASDGNPVTTTFVVMLFFLAFTLLEANVEKLIYGERFEHWLDPIFICGFIAYAAYAVVGCAVYNSTT